MGNWWQQELQAAPLVAQQVTEDRLNAILIVAGIVTGTEVANAFPAVALTVRGIFASGLQGIKAALIPVGQALYRVAADSNGSANIFPSFGGSLDAGERAIAAARQAASAGAESGVAATVQLGKRFFTDWSSDPRRIIGAPTFFNPYVESALESVPYSLRTSFHGSCAEIGCLSQILNAGLNPNGSIVVPVLVRVPGSLKLGAYLSPCPTCRFVLPMFGIEWGTP